MSLTDNTYFVRDCSIPIRSGFLDDTKKAIDRYEPEILEYILGYALAKLVIAYTSGSDQRIKDIVEGKEYTQGTYTVHWNGLKNDDKVSICTYYVYIQYLKDKSMSFQNVGVIESAVENGVNVGPGSLIQRASASLRELIGYPGQDVYAPSLYNFLTTYSDTYPEWIWTEYKFQNTLGI